MFDFDTIYDRRTPGDVKYEPIRGTTGVIPMWVADMDFKTAPCVETAVNAVAAKGIYGYQSVDEEYLCSVRSWYSRRFSFEILDEWILPSPAVMYSVACAIRALTDEGDTVLILEPVYYPFKGVILHNRRQLVISDLVNLNGLFTIDFDDLESKIKKDHVKAVLFCSPHNPVGRVWTRHELERFAEICLNNGVKIISDDIHSDLVFAPNRHIPVAALSEEVAANTVTCVAPTKTFNLASIEASQAIIPDPAIRRAVQKEMIANCRYGVNTFAVAAAKAVYTQGETWLDALLNYLDESRAILSQAFPENSLISVNQPQGTYLAWLDCRRLGLCDNMLYNRFLLESGVRLHKGSTFGKSSEGFMRLNFACPHSVLQEAVQRIRKTITGERSC
ncbi:MAG: pyridoxal phosphate-dependent aminotransferase [Ruminococcus sp.]|nr:pyridoxal phosphate-dependent aminotransferase [Ruminococcus sp.]MBQ6336818.1 pyridoxal phosphate-dependent aminotransferase [Ruminococcus sp.]